MRVDHFGTFLTLRFAMPEMVKSGGGSVINMVSVAGFGNLTGGRSAYASSKAAVMNLTRTTAHAFAKDRIRVNAIAPAVVGTERIKKMLADRPEIKVALAAQQLGLIKPQDIAYAAILLASDESRMIMATYSQWMQVRSPIEQNPPKRLVFSFQKFRPTYASARCEQLRSVILA